MAEKLSKGTALIGQSGGPTAVINQSLVGVVEELRASLVKRGIVQRVYGMRHGVNGLVKGELVDLTRYPRRQAAARRDHAQRRPGLLTRQARRRVLRADPRAVQAGQRPLFLLHRRERFVGHLPHRQRTRRRLGL
jgi:6-phosphofructokinase